MTSTENDNPLKNYPYTTFRNVQINEDPKKHHPLVIKIGSSTVTDKNKRVDFAFLDSLAKQVFEVMEMGWQPVIVTSAGIACGLEALGIKKRPTDMPSLQAAASVGASVLSASYAEAFAKHGLLTSLVLLTRRDTADRRAYLHARDTLTRLLSLGVVPIVNENDTVSVEYIRFGENDTLAALVACLIDADLVVMMSDIEGLYDDNPKANPDASLIERVEVIDKRIMQLGKDASTDVGTGGMLTKIKAARVLMVAGIPLVICNGRRPDAIVDAAKGLPVGTLFEPHGQPHEITPKKLWIALGNSVKGSVTVDDGAKNALVRRGSSLLSVGVTEVDGSFEAGDIIDIMDLHGDVFARGKVGAESDAVSLAIGLTREAIESNHLLSQIAERPIVHRDDLVVFE